jgi:thioredoxin reductase
MVRGWTRDLTVFTNGAIAIPVEAIAQLRGAGIAVETAPISRLVAHSGRLQSIALASGAAIPCDVLFTQPPQRHTDLVRSLGLALDEEGYVKVDSMKRETSVAGIYASGDLITRGQAAILAAASGMQAAAAINVDLAMSPQ